MLRKVLLATCFAAATAIGAQASAAVTTHVYSGHTDVGGGTPYSGFVGDIVTPGPYVSFATDTGFDWHPFGLGDFGSDSVGSFVIGADGTYTFHLGSDDGALVFIDGTLLIDRGGPHPPTFTDGTTFLTAGVHDFEVQFFECCGGPSGVDFGIGASGAVPEPAMWALMIAGFGLVGLQLRAPRRRLSA